jgi:hypothetical protein
LLSRETVAVYKKGGGRAALNRAALEGCDGSQYEQVRRGASYVNIKNAALQLLQVLSLTISPLAISWAKSRSSSNSIFEFGTQAR